jgi:hypothetical protein
MNFGIGICGGIFPGFYPILVIGFPMAVSAMPFSTAWPNPSRDRLLVNFGLDRDLLLKYQCFNIKGQMVCSHSIFNAKVRGDFWKRHSKDLDGNEYSQGCISSGFTLAFK